MNEPYGQYKAEPGQMEVSETPQESSALPDHVPGELVAELPLGRGQFTTERPHDIIARLHQGPEAFFAPNGPVAGGT